MSAVPIEPIGLIRTSFLAKDVTPIQGAFRPDSRGTVELLPEYEEGLADIEGFSHLILIYHLNQGSEIRLTREPFLADEEHGIFATRHPCRPNRIGLTVVRLMQRRGCELSVAGIDVLDETPLIDLKPYVPRFDAFPEADEGWFAGRENRPKPVGRE